MSSDLQLPFLKYNCHV